MPSPLARRLVWSAVAASVVTACSDQPQAPETAGAGPSLAATAMQSTGAHLIALKGAETAAFDAAVAAAGGTIIRRHPEISLVAVQGLSNRAAGQLAARPDVDKLAADQSLQWLPPPAQFAGSKLDLPAGAVRPQGQDQSGAVFYSYQWNIRQVQANLAWVPTPAGAGRTVCILDTGVDPDHLDMAGKVDPARFVSFSTDASFPGNQDPYDYHFHGTATAGYIAGNGIGMASVAPGATLCSAKVLGVTGSGSFGDLIAAILWAGTTANADVINMSLGAYVDRRFAGNANLVEFLQRAVSAARGEGTVIVASAGNFATNLDADEPYLIHLPSQLNGVLSIGATGPFNQTNFDGLASYSNYGGKTGVDFMAPGGDYISGNVLDYDLTTCSQYQLTLPFSCGAGSYLFVVGTSESAPHVAGAAALVQSVLGGVVAPGRVERCLSESTDRLMPASVFGRGRLNVFRASGCT